MATWTCENGHLNPSTELTKCLDCGVQRARQRGLTFGPPSQRPVDLRGTLTTLWLVGVGVLLVSGIVVAAAWPGTSTADCGLDSDCVIGEQDGSLFLTLVGLVGMGIGQAVLLVAIVAEGVRLGIRAAGLGRDA